MHRLYFKTSIAVNTLHIIFLLMNNWVSSFFFFFFYLKKNTIMQIFIFVSWYMCVGIFLGYIPWVDRNIYYYMLLNYLIVFQSSYTLLPVYTMFPPK